jgi:hypothetical protein
VDVLIAVGAVVAGIQGSAPGSQAFLD